MKTIVIAVFVLVVGGLMIYQVCQTFDNAQKSFQGKIDRALNVQ